MGRPKRKLVFHNQFQGRTVSFGEAIDCFEFEIQK